MKAISPFGQHWYNVVSKGQHFVFITASQSIDLFAHRHLPMGKKKKNLCALRGSNERSEWVVEKLKQCT